jgi:hypothetical protein
MNPHWTPEEQAEQLKKAVERLRKNEGERHPEQSKRPILSTAKREVAKKRKSKT